MSGAQKSPFLSAIISALLCVIITAGLLYNADWFAATQVNTILGGYLCSWLFIFCLTMVSNIEMIVFGYDFQVGFAPEIPLCLAEAIIFAGFIHRVCATSCILFSIIGLYFVNRISANYHSKSDTAGGADQQMYAKRSGGSKKNK